MCLVNAVKIIRVMGKIYSSLKATTVVPSIMHTTYALALCLITRPANDFSHLTNKRFIDIRIITIFDTCVWYKHIDCMFVKYGKILSLMLMYWSRRSRDQHRCQYFPILHEHCTVYVISIHERILNHPLSEGSTA